MRPLVFLDMDGVLVDFIGGIARHFGRNLDSMPRVYSLSQALGLPFGEIDLKLRSDPKFWFCLRPLPHAVALYRRLCEECEVIILSHPWDNDVMCHAGKLDWCKRHLNCPPQNVILTKHKQLVAAPGRILIDDHLENCKEWSVRGGVALEYPAWHNGLPLDIGSPDNVIRSINLGKRLIKEHNHEHVTSISAGKN